MTDARRPPRFVPTLTTVLDLPQDAPTATSGPAVPVTAAVGVHEAGEAAFQAIAPVAQTQLTEADAFRLEDQLMHRVLQRVDLSLEECLSDTVSAAVQQQLDAMIPHLRSEIESVLRSLVSEALSRELSENPGSARAGGE